MGTGQDGAMDTRPVRGTRGAGGGSGRPGRGWGQEKVSVSPRRAPTLPSMLWSSSAGTTAQLVLGRRCQGEGGPSATESQRPRVTGVQQARYQGGPWTKQPPGQRFPQNSLGLMRETWETGAPLLRLL